MAALLEDTPHEAVFPVVAQGEGAVAHLPTYSVGISVKSFLEAKVMEGLKSGLLATNNVHRFHIHLYLTA